MQRKKYKQKTNYIMNILNNMLNFMFHVEYWTSFFKFQKIKRVLKIFFKNEDKLLQEAFIKNFDYPIDMVNPPVRLEHNSGDIYYTLNFKSKELYENTGTKEQALSNSLVLLDKLLPLGVTQYIEPLTPVEIPDTFSILCSLSIINRKTLRSFLWNIFGILIKISIFSAIVYSIIKYFYIFSFLI